MFGKHTASRLAQKVYHTPSLDLISLHSRSVANANKRRSNDSRGVVGENANEPMEMEIATTEQQPPLIQNEIESMTCSSSGALEQYAQNKAEQTQCAIAEEEQKTRAVKLQAEQKAKARLDAAKRTEEEEKRKSIPVEITPESVPTTHLLKRPTPVTTTTTTTATSSTPPTGGATNATNNLPPSVQIQTEKPLGSKRVYYSELVPARHT